MKGGGWAVALWLLVLPAPAPAGEARLLFAGDVMLAREVAHEVARTGRSPWSDLPLFRNADFAMANFEGAVGEDGDCGTHTPCFAVRPRLLKALAEAGVGAVGIANNHAADLGPAGRAATKAALRAAGVAPLDFADSPGFVRIGGRTVAVVAISLVAGRDGRIDPVPSLAAERALRLARTLADWVVVFIHWGAELRGWPQESQQRAADWLIDHGADVIIGHHPHVVTPPACLRGRPVFWSLGNHVFDQKYDSTKAGMIADCRIGGDVLTCRPLLTRTPIGSSFPHLEGEGRPLADCGVPAGSGLSVAGWRLRPAGEGGRLVSGPMALEGTATGRAGWTVVGRTVLALEAGRLTASGAESLFALERHVSTIDHEDAPRPYVYDVGENGIVARWRGSALAWPLLDARLMAGEGEMRLLCALHRGDSFLRLDPATTATRTAVYRWSGFGFAAVTDAAAIERCRKLYEAVGPVR